MRNPFRTCDASGRLPHPGGAKWEYVWGRTLADATEQMIEAAGVTEGMRVLDVACGAGSQTLQAAEHVGGEGHVVATDISATMLEYVRRSAAEAGAENVSTLEGAAEELDLAGGSFDAAICRLGAMLFSAPGQAVAAVGRALRTGGRFAALVFTTPENNPFMSVPMGLLLRHTETPPPAPGTPGLFALGRDGVVDSLLSGAGLTQMQTTKVRAPIRFDSLDDAVIFFQEAAGAYRSVVATLNEPEQTRAWDVVREGLSQFRDGDGVGGELEFVIASGARAT